MTPAGAARAVISLARRRKRRRAGAAEREARAILGMLPGHPERLTAALPDADERFLTYTAAVLWPHDEYAFELDEGDP